MLSVVNAASEPWFSKIAENCIGADVLPERGVVCISKEQLDHYFVWNTQSAAFQRIVFCFPIANMYLVL